MNKSDVIKRLNQAESNEAAELLREILRSSVRQALYQLVEEEVKGLCGPKYDRNKSAEYYRAGVSPLLQVQEAESFEVFFAQYQNLASNG